MTANHQGAKSIFLNAAEIGAGAQREAYIAEQCGADEALRKEVEELLAHHDQISAFLRTGPATAVAERPRDDGPGAVIGPYKLRERIGEGGMGLVYVAEQLQPVRRKVALKLIKPGMDSQQVIARFEAERQALAMMDHPNIAKVHDGGVTPEGRPYFVMELVKGLPITDYCDKSRLGTRQRLELFLDVCHAVQHAHQKGIIHRDLKPSNILVEVHDVRPVIKIIDFGISKAIGQQLTDKTLYTAVAHMVGTPIYMSPEQAGLSSLDVDTRSDVYSLGVLLYELLTGTTPFESETLKKAGYDEMRRIIREDEPSKPSTRLNTMEQANLSTIAEKRGLEPQRLSRQMRGELDWIVMKALEKDRNRRYESASAFAADVQRYLNEDAVEACPPSAGYRMRKFIHRNRRALMTAGVITFALVVATVLSVWQAIEANAARQLADERLKNETLALKSAAVDSAIAREVNAFLQEDLLQQIESLPEFTEEYTAEPKLSVKEALDRAAARIGDRFQDQPLVEAAIRTVIGDSYRNLMAHRLAVPHLERAVALRKAHLGADQPATIASMNSLANAFMWAGQHPDAIALHQHLLEISKALLGSEHSETIDCTARLAGSYQFAGQMDISVRLFEQVLEKRRTILGPTHPKTLYAMHHLAMNYADVGRLEESLALHASLLELLRATIGPNNELPTWPMRTFAQACQLAGKLDRAEELLSEALTIDRKSNDSVGGRSGTANTLGWLALNLSLQQRYEAAEPLAREAVAIKQPQIQRHFYWMSLLGAILLGRHKYAEAEPLLLQGYDGMKQSEATIPAGEKRRLAEAGERVVRFYELTNQPEKARQWRERHLEDESQK
jgi:serine/threonine protein kinase/tetratricopeptide (TPR) repeat protein